MISSLIVVIILFISFTHGKSHGKTRQNLNSLKQSLEADVVGFYSLPVTYYFEEQIQAETDETNYFVLKQCSSTRANFAYVQVNIIAPDNPTLNPNISYVVMEFSKTKDKWDATTIFATNYIYDIQNPTIFTSIAWEYNSQPQDVYARYRAYGRSLPLTLLISYSDTLNPNKGIYKPNYIAGTVSAGFYEELSQYIKASQTYQVNNNQRVVFNFSACTRTGIDPNEWNRYTLGVNVAGDISSPLSAFNLVACSVSEYPDPNYCTYNNIDAVKRQSASPLVSLEISNDEYTDLSHGTYLAVYGEGGNIDGSNVFVVEVTITKS